MKIAITAKLQNGALVELLHEKGWTQTDLARACEVTPSVVSLWMAMRAMPKSAAVRARIEQGTGRLCEDLFPPELEQMPRADVPRTVTVIRDMNAEQILTTARRLALAQPEDYVFARERQDILQATIDQALSPLQAQVLERRWGLHGTEPETYEAIGIRFHVSRERVRQIELVALRKLRHPSYSQRLREAVDVLVAVT